ncbi:hypothetical protein WICANDRAFT_85371 [Wickerhamomyces anomalus NRRL Y-366-8]|uniref:Uncharacterized protein n=1 Tax=Wickerhamomyces anomalus (strain ATCC 58044 / CBS 1984 / NCYC 433 / NRRL Y-366-8) TaxID=683960 RepID=A0A1E3NYN1_WICAA|nr:uncharacterized protein WICANDRAFT_85371 [Wickerhamomyces anomalus NRRL Y-366-8]ODQ58311.1 hypothetical protein WICANDRAFT_85371 [Wickerhamomyces anomalus NRRL Y-366-8]
MAKFVIPRPRKSPSKNMNHFSMTPLFKDGCSSLRDCEELKMSGFNSCSIEKDDAVLIQETIAGRVLQKRWDYHHGPFI